MADNETKDTDEDLTFRRRDVLKTVGAAGAIGAIGAETAAAKKPKRVIVGTKPGKAGVAKGRANRVDKVIDFGDIGQAVLGRWPEQALKGLQNNPNVEYIEEESIGHVTQETLPYGIDRVDAEVAHANGDTGSGSHIGIVDTGIDLDHPDLVGNLADPSDPAEHSAFVDCNDSSHPDGNCQEDWDDDDSHGTHVAGIADAVDNTEDVIGVSTEATLHSIKVCDDTGSCPCGDVADGIREAADNGYDVANVSIGGCGGSTVENAVDYAVDLGTIVVASAGNAGPCTDCVSAPASFDNSIAVSSTTDTDSLSGFSSQGPEVDFAAPGSSVLSTVPSAMGSGGTGFKSGTSMAAPHVAGAVAQLRANSVSPGNVQTVLENTAENIGLSDNEQGAGLLDVANALGYDSANDLLEVETRFADDIQYTEARLNGRLTELTGNDSAEVFFQYREVGTTSWTTTPTETRTSAGFFDRVVTGLGEDTSYEFRAGATVEEPAEGWSSTEHGDVEDFDTVDNPDPTAAFTVSPDPVVRNEPATFDASGSDSGEISGLPADSIVSYEWDFDGDGTFEASTPSPTIDHTFTTGGAKTVTLRVTDEFDQIDTVSATFTVHIRVAVDISPNGTGPNSINPDRRGNVAVAVLHTSAFDPPARLDHSTVHFGDPDDVGFDSSGEPEGGAAPAHAGGHVEDVDGDGDMDSLFHFPIPDADFESDDTEGELVGLMNDGVPVFGTDDVNIVGGGGS